MEILKNTALPFSIPVFITVGLAVFFVFRLAHYLQQFLKLSYTNHRRLVRYLPLSELIAWMLFMIWSAQYLVARGLVVSMAPVIVLLVTILYLCWYTLRDVVSGIIFKSGKNIEINDHIMFETWRGKIVGMSFRTLQLEDDSGRMIIIPYSKIIDATLIKSHPSQSLISHNFDFSIPAGKDIFDTINQLRYDIITLPWSPQRKEPKIVIKEEKSNQWTFSITIFCPHSQYFKRTEKHLEQKYLS